MVRGVGVGGVGSSAHTDLSRVAPIMTYIADPILRVHLDAPLERMEKLRRGLGNIRRSVRATDESQS